MRLTLRSIACVAAFPLVVMTSSVQPQTAFLQPADAVNARQAHAKGFHGHGTTVVIIDPSGFDTASPGLRGRLAGEACVNGDVSPNICPIDTNATQFAPGVAAV